MEEKTKAEEVGERVQAAGKKVQQVGCALTLLITLPIVGFAIFSWIGGIVGGVLGLLVFVGMFVKEK